MPVIVDFKNVSVIGLESSPVPEELEGKFRFARQKSKLAVIIRGSFFVIKNEY